MSNQIITPLEVGNISVGDDIRIYVPTVQDDLGVPLEYGLTRWGRVTNVDVDHDGVQAVVKLDTDPPDTDEEVFAGYLIGGGNGNLIAIRISIEDETRAEPGNKPHTPVRPSVSPGGRSITTGVLADEATVQAVHDG